MDSFVKSQREHEPVFVFHWLIYPVIVCHLNTPRFLLITPLESSEKYDIIVHNALSIMLSYFVYYDHEIQFKLLNCI